MLVFDTSSAWMLKVSPRPREEHTQVRGVWIRYKLEASSVYPITVLLFGDDPICSRHAREHTGAKAMKQNSTLV